MRKVPASPWPDPPNADQAALSGWGPTARLCLIRLTESIPLLVPIVVMLVGRH
jgi:hypothetical protein